MDTLKSTSDVIEALGGIHAVAKLVGARTPTVVNNWRRRGFPARFYPKMNHALASAGLTAPSKLWGIDQ